MTDDPLQANGRPIDTLLEIMARLRDPVDGCPWDKVQTFRTIAPYTVEEAYEVADAVERGDRDDLKDELGDLLLQVVYHARMAEEEGSFDFDAVTEAISGKMIARHPHVFGADRVADAEAMNERWEARKAEERRRKAEAEGRRPSQLDGVPAGLPAVTRAVKLQRRAARVGFDWPEIHEVLDKIVEEAGELRDVLPASRDAPAPDATTRDRIEDEVGDLLFAAINLARWMEIDPEQALRRTNTKFERRFRRIEEVLSGDGRTPAEASLEEMESIWQAAKSLDRSG